jgi:cell division protein FtsB
VRNIGIRIQRYKLRRYRAPESISERARLGLAVALAGWVIWALFVSDHSAVRLLALDHRKDTTERRLAAVSEEVKRGIEEVRTVNDPAVIERILRERHNFAREGELLYVIQADGSVGALREIPTAPDSSGRP